MWSYSDKARINPRVFNHFNILSKTVYVMEYTVISS